MKLLMENWRQHLKEAEAAWKGPEELDPASALTGTPRQVRHPTGRGPKTTKTYEDEDASKTKAKNVKKRKHEWFVDLVTSDLDRDREQDDAEWEFVSNAVEEYFKDSSDPGPWHPDNKVEAIGSFLSWLNKKHACSSAKPDPCTEALSLLKKLADEGPQPGEDALPDRARHSWRPTPTTSAMSKFRKTHDLGPGNAEAVLEAYIEENQCRDKTPERTPCDRADSYIEYFEKGLESGDLKKFGRALRWTAPAPGREAEEEFFGDPLVRESRKLTKDGLKQLIREELSKELK